MAFFWGPLLHFTLLFSAYLLNKARAKRTFWRKKMYFLQKRQKKWHV